MVSRRIVPIAAAAALVAGLSWQADRPRQTGVQSQRVTLPMPALDLPSARNGEAPLTNAALATGKPQLVNLFGSWCGPCIAEASQLATLNREGVSIVGIAIRDRPEAVTAFLGEHGDPFRAIGLDRDGRFQQALGAAGVPETYVVDGRGRIRRRFVGGLDEAAQPDVRRALAEAAQ